MTENPEPRDVEARLRASLHAYAELADEAPTRRRPAGTAPGGLRRPSGVRRWRAPALVAAAVLAVAGGAWLVVDHPPTSSTTAAPGSSRAEGGPEAAAAQPPADTFADAQPSEDMAAAAVGPGGQFVVPPPVEVGVAYPFDLYTHCGILGADVAGVWFAADPPLVEPGGNPPAGWDNPYQRGTLTLDSSDVAAFRDAAGHELVLRAAESERPPPCA